MMRSLYSGVSGLRVHQTKMDVIGNNIANVNTVGYKTSRVTFTQVFSQTTQSATGSNTDTGRGGVNAMQIGLGTSVGSIYSDPTSEGSAQRTDNPFDLKISGDNFFVVNDGTSNYFTKVGAFTLDDAGYMVTQSGYHVMGWQTDPKTGEIKQDMVSPLGITTPENNNVSPEATSANYFAGNIDKTNSDVQSAEGLVMSMSIYDSEGYSYTVKYTLKQNPEDKTGSSYTMKLTDIIDSENNSILGTDTDKYTATIGGTDATGTEITVKYNEATGDFEGLGLSSAATGATPTFDTGTNSFNLIIKPNNTANDNPFYTSQATGGTALSGIAVDMSTTTMYANNGKSTLTSVRGNLKGIGAGRTSGEMSGVAIGTDGKITATYSNGDTKLLGQISVASFENAAGLEKIGDSMYTTTANSGTFDGIGKDPTAGGGSITQGVLEMSNVDLSNEFTEMITTQRGFQANSRIITVSDTLLEELVNLKR
ncbi:MAG: flagellar hook protein FlgE [Lachnospiraceae bacterium]|nr:flagellar hook protein FlgE [Lachnospiraceae bacterium]